MVQGAGTLRHQAGLRDESNAVRPEAVRPFTPWPDLERSLSPSPMAW